LPSHLKALLSFQKEAEFGKQEASSEEASGYGSEPRFNRRIPFPKANKSRVSPVGLSYDEACTVLRELRSQFKSIKGG
jgi:hypothetical protein